MIELTQDRRQRDAARRNVLERLRAGDPAPALEELHRAGDLQFADSMDAAVESLVANYVDAVAHGEDAVMLAVRRAEVAALNRAARRELASRGHMAQTALTVHGVELAVGDRVLLRVNDRALDVQNGTRAVIAAVDPVRFTIDLDLENGRTVRLTGDYLSRSTRDGSPEIVHGYAATGHAAQGITLDSAFVLAGDAVYREWMYVALSRARNRTLVITPSDRASATAHDNLQRLAGQVARSQAQTMALDHERLDDVRELLSRAIGPRPERPSDALRWDRALEAMTALRHAHQVASVDELLGPQPFDRAGRLRWLAAHRAVQRAVPERDRRLERER